jgi:hypothetical protein
MVGEYRGTRSGPVKLKMYACIAAAGVSQPEKRRMRQSDSEVSPNSSGFVRQLKKSPWKASPGFFPEMNEVYCPSINVQENVLDQKLSGFDE